MTIYSPTTTEVAQRCLRFFQLRRLWAVPEFPFRPNIPAGLAIHAGLACSYLGGTDRDVERAIAESLIATSPASELVKLSGLCYRAVIRAREQGVQMPPEELVAVEQEWYGARVDLVTRNADGLIVTDTKCPWRIEDEEVRRSRLEEAEASWQLHHLGWAVREVFGELPAHGRIQQIVLNPKITVECKVVLDYSHEKLDRWYASAKVWWELMRHYDPYDGETRLVWSPPAPMNFEGCWSKYGRCEMYDICHRGLDPARVFQQRERAHARS